MKIGVLGAVDNEIMPFIRSMSHTVIKETAKLRFHIGQYADIDVVALSCGVCKVNAAIASQILIDLHEVSHIIMVGVAGAIDETLHIFDTVVSTEIAYHDVDDNILTCYHPFMQKSWFEGDKELVDRIIHANADHRAVIAGKIVTGETFIEQSGRDRIIKKFDPLCVDMETASVAHVCYVNSIPFAAIRSMSDTPHESGIDAFEKYVDQAACKSIDVLKRFLEQLQSI